MPEHIAACDSSSSPQRPGGEDESAGRRRHLPLARPRITADDLQIAGMSAMSSVDWPGKLVATVFCQGCPWACPYCHNHAIIDPRIPGVIAWSSVEDLLARRHGLLDGVVFSGGEATRQLALIPAAQAVKAAGFSVGLHTAGPYPSRLRDLYDADLLDWVGLDIKALPGKNYEIVAGRANAGDKAWESLQVVLDHPDVDYEVRLTIYPDGPQDAYEVARCCREKGVKCFALQQARPQGAPAGFDSGTAAWDDQVQALARDIDALGFAHFSFRPST